MPPNPARKCENCDWFEVSYGQTYCDKCKRSPVVLEKLLAAAEAELAEALRDVRELTRRNAALEQENDALRRAVKQPRPVNPPGQETPKITDWQKHLEERARNLDLD